MPESKPKRRRKPSGPTMAAVAEKAGVSIFTVSAVVNGTAQVSDERRLRVEQAIEAIGYKHNAVARSLKTGRTLTIGVVVGDITNPFYTDVVAVIQQELHRSGYAVMLCCNDRSAELQAEHISLLRNRMVDGLIISPVGNDEQLQAALEGARIPVVLVDRTLRDNRYDAVVLDNKAAVTEAMQYLLSLGHRRIGFISGNPATYTGRHRLEGYRASLKAAGIPIEDDLCQLGGFRAEEAYTAALRLLTGPNPPTAIFPANNLMMIGAMKAVRDLGLTCPDDVSVVGFDDFPWAEAFIPQLTTIAQPVRQIGEESVRLLVERLGEKSKPVAPRRVQLKGELKVRTSCRPLVARKATPAPRKARAKAGR
jgi:LacI family transcriptional regulator